MNDSIIDRISDNILSWWPLYFVGAMILSTVVVIVWTNYEFDRTENIQTLIVIGKTLVDSGYEVCILDSDSQRILTTPEGCAYNNGDRVKVKFRGPAIVIEGFA